jgi:hypothetical protein
MVQTKTDEPEGFETENVPYALQSAEPRVGKPEVWWRKLRYMRCGAFLVTEPEVWWRKLRYMRCGAFLVTEPEVWWRKLRYTRCGAFFGYQTRGL